MSHDLVEWQHSLFGHADRRAITIGDAMTSVYVELLGVAHYRPVNGYRLTHDAELDERAELSSHAKALFNHFRVTGGFEIHIATVSTGKTLYLVNHINPTGIKRQIRSTLFC